MKPRKIPMRMCIVTHEKMPKKELVRIVRTPEDNVVVDLTGKVNGRGAYIKKDSAVISKAKASKIFEKHLEVAIPEEVYTQLFEICGGDEK